MAPQCLDHNVMKVLPGIRVESIYDHTESAWAKTSRINAVHRDGSKESYFMKVSQGYHGRESVKGEFESTWAIYSITPDFCPKPIAWGTFQSDPMSHFYICKFFELSEGLPDPETFCASLAKLHSFHTSPTSKYGFEVSTYNGDIPQDNTWSDSWEKFFSKGFKQVLKIRESRGGRSVDLEDLLPTFFNKVIPRLLRPLETGSNRILPSLVHGDLWHGNAAVARDIGGIVFDPASFWGHNEYELGNWRPERNKFTQQYFDTYHTFFPIAVPEDDYDDRNALYAIRFNLNAAALFPNHKTYLDLVINEMRRLNVKFPLGVEAL